MSNFQLEVRNIIIILLTRFVVIIIYIFFFLLSVKIDKEIEVISCYECGFDPIRIVRITFSYRFFLLSILFLIFDVEIILFLIVPFLVLREVRFILFNLFIIVLIFGLVYEWIWGSLNWF